MAHPQEPKSFAWSYSRLTAFELCPARYNALSVAKTVVEDESEQQRYGNQLHADAAEFLKFLQSPKALDIFKAHGFIILAGN